MSWDFSLLLTSDYFFYNNPGGAFLIGYVLLGYFVFLCFLPGIVKNIASSNKYFRKSIKKKFGKFIFFGIGGVILVASRFASIPGFSTRIWLYLIFVGSVVALVWTVIRVFLDYRKRLDSVKREQLKQQY
ncbi:hypothetical protein KAI58_03520 [Candidatus Gracilibacteria bacterium]|nr:hypothetical protein [Candidatus Gracilibacteria bacterium]